MSEMYECVCICVSVSVYMRMRVRASACILTVSKMYVCV